MANPVGATRSGTVRLLAGLAALYLAVATAYAATEVFSGPGGLDEQTLPLIGAAFLSMLTLLALASRFGAASGLFCVMVLSFAAQMGWAIWIDAQPFSVFGELWETARRLAAEPDPDLLFSSPSPMAVAVYASAVRLFGPELEAVRIVAAALWTIQTALVWLIARQVREAKSGATAAAAMVGLTPAVVVFGALPSVEAVFAPLALASVYIIISHRNRGLLLSAVLSGILIALAFLTRPTAIAFAIPIALVLFSAAWSARRLRAKAGLFLGLIAFLLSIAATLWPVLNAQSEREVSTVAKLAPSLSFELMYGANRASGGGFDPADLERIGFSGAADEFAEAERAARALALRRAAEDPIGLAAFAATEKMRKLWSTERALLSWTADAPSPRRSELARYDVKRLGGALIDGAYLAILALATAGAIVLAVSGAVRDPSRWSVLLGAFALLALSHAMLQAEPRQHLSFLPLLAVFGGVALTPRPRAARADQAVDIEGDDAGLGADPVGPVEPNRQQKIASVLAQMSKPPRPEDEGGPRAAPVAPRPPASRAGAPGPSAASPTRRGHSSEDEPQRMVSAPR